MFMRSHRRGLMTVKIELHEKILEAQEKVMEELREWARQVMAGETPEETPKVIKQLAANYRRRSEERQARAAPHKGILPLVKGLKPKVHRRGLAGSCCGHL